MIILRQWWSTGVLQQFRELLTIKVYHHCFKKSSNKDTLGFIKYFKTTFQNSAQITHLTNLFSQFTEVGIRKRHKIQNKLYGWVAYSCMYLCKFLFFMSLMFFPVLLYTLRASYIHLSILRQNKHSVASIIHTYFGGIA